MNYDRRPDYGRVWQPAPHGAQIIIELQVEQNGGPTTTHHAFVAVPPGCVGNVELRAWAYMNPTPPPPPPLTPEKRRHKLITAALIEGFGDRTVEAMVDAVAKALADDFDKADRYEGLG